MAVRRERVILDLQDDFSSGMVRAAGATAMLRRELRDLDGMSVRITQTFNDNTRGVDQFSRSLDQSGRSIDRYSGRLAALAQAGLVFGPGAIPVTAVATAGVAGLASQLGFAAIGMGSLVVATRGVGDALKALNEAALEPTADNIEKARVAMAELGPEAQQFVLRFQELRPVLGDLRDAAAAGWFPGLTEALDHFELVAPRVASLFEALGRAGGQLVAEGAEALAGGEWAEFLSFVEREGPESLEQLGRSVGNVVHGLAELWMAFAPLNDDFSTWLLNASRDFDAWAAGLAQTQGFEDFIEYVRRVGPQVGQTLGAIAESVVSIVEAASPLGGPVLEAFETIADLVRAIAESPVGPKIFTMAAAFLVLNKTLAVTAGLLARTGFVGAAGALRNAGPAAGTGAGPGAPGVLPIASRVTATRTAFGQLRTDLTALRSATMAQRNASTSLIAAQARVNTTMRQYGSTVAKAGAGAGAFAVATGAIGGGLGLQNTAMLGLVGTMAGPWGAAVGAGIGLTIDLANATGQYADAQERANAAVKSNNVEQITAAIAEQRKILAGAMDSDKVTGVGDFFSDVGRGLTGGGGADVKARAKKQIAELEDALRGVRKETLLVARQEQITLWAEAVSEEFLSLGRAIDKPTLSLDRLMKRMENQGRAARDMGKNLREALANGADPEALQRLIDELGPQAGLVLEQLAKGGEDAAARFNRGWGRTQNLLAILEKAIEDVGAAVNRLPDGKIIKIDADTRRAARAIDRIREEAKSVAKDWQVRFIVTQTNRINKPEINGPGSPQNYATGGYTGWGGKYQPAGIVHRGEVVIPQELVARDRDLLRNRYGHLPGMEQLHSGGMAGYTQAEAVARSRAALAASAQAVRMSSSSAPAVNVTTQLSRDDLDYLAERLERARPMYGDVHMAPHDYSEFRRQMADDRARMQRGGFGRR